jgi:branched-subunit amino acid transport protein
MSAPAAIATFVAIGVLTFAMRASFIFLLSHMRMPAWFEQALRYVPAAALSALVWPEIVIGRGGALLSPDTYPKLIAGAVALVSALITRSVPLTLVLGMAALWLAQAVLP